MSNRDPDARYESPTQAIPFWGEQLLKHGVRTALPGVVVSYDTATNRARVQPAVDLLLTDGQSQTRAIILDVPVLFQSTSRYISHVALEANDPVWLMFSQRSLTAFKRTLTQGPPDTDAIMSETDAVAFPGFVPMNAVPRDGYSIQTTDGSTYIELTEGNVTVMADSSTYIEVTNGNVTIMAGTVTINGVDFSTHTHSGVQSGSGNTGGPS